MAQPQAVLHASQKHSSTELALKMHAARNSPPRPSWWRPASRWSPGPPKPGMTAVGGGGGGLGALWACCLGSSGTCQTRYTHVGRPADPAVNPGLARDGYMGAGRWHVPFMECIKPSSSKNVDSLQWYRTVRAGSWLKGLGCKGG